MPPKRKQFTLEQKIAILKDVDTGMKKLDVAKKYDISPSSLTTILKKRNKIEKSTMFNAVNPMRKRLRAATYDKVDEATFKWFLQIRSLNIPVTGTLICQKAKQLAVTLGEDGFCASQGWLEKFRTRHNILCKGISGEEMSAPADAIAQWQSGKLKEIMASFPPKNIFNADETALMYRLLPERTMAVKTDKCKGGKKAKDRITVLLCCHADGTEML
ncbi:tigger transposable element-derived protein 6-like [Ischnura elegans]|uniref:tigger transposable element-derived protein 6-like n=1 Tax=Ischnura elegans TaxID=197161 RepID=UPI001ED875BC|nr:tigger transposable element-derived protein 6-like [Ischnura elegans]